MEYEHFYIVNYFLLDSCYSPKIIACGAKSLNKGIKPLFLYNYKSTQQAKKINVGDRVRRSVRNKKDAMYKSNSGVQWDPRTYIVLGKSKNGMSFKLKIHVKLKNKWQDVIRWIPGDRLQKLPASDDKKTEKMLAERLQSGSVRKPVVRRVSSPPKPRKRLPRKAAKLGLVKRRANE